MSPPVLNAAASLTTVDERCWDECQFRRSFVLRCLLDTSVLVAAEYEEMICSCYSITHPFFCALRTKTCHRGLSKKVREEQCKEKIGTNLWCAQRMTFLPLSTVRIPLSIVRFKRGKMITTIDALNQWCQNVHDKILNFRGVTYSLSLI